MTPPTTTVLRYPGGKRRMLAFLRNHLLHAAQIAGSYVEPFLGGGAVFFSIQPQRAVLSDINSELIDIYRGIRLAPRKVWKLYCEFGNTKEDYFRVRDIVAGTNVIERAARMLYLNRTCFKGMWRHNRKGDFNVGYGGEARRWVFGEAELLAVAKVLRNKVITCSDYQTIIERCSSDDFVFLDPPYRPGAKEYDNAHYCGRKFSLDDHERLAATLHSARNRNVRWALTTSSHSEVVRLFNGCYITYIPRGTGRMPGISTSDSGEVLITSYHSQDSKRI